MKNNFTHLINGFVQGTFIFAGFNLHMPVLTVIGVIMMALYVYGLLIGADFSISNLFKRKKHAPINPIFEYVKENRGCKVEPDSALEWCKDNEIDFGSAECGIIGYIMNLENANKELINKFVKVDPIEKPMTWIRDNNMKNKHEKWCDTVSKKVAKVCPETDRTVKIYSSVYQAALELGGKEKSSNISKAINGQLKTAYKFKWIKLK